MGTTLHKDLAGADLHVNKLHADTHVAAGTDPLVLAESQVTDLVPDLASKVDEGDARLTDARTPTPHAHSEEQITDLVSDLADKVETGDARLSDARTPVVHSHTESDVTDLVDDLAGKAPTVHTHVKADITDFPAISAGTVTAVTGTSPIVSSEGATPAISLPAATNAAPGHATAAQIAALEAATAAQHAIATIGTGNGLSIAGQAISLAPATASVPGAATAAQITKLDGIAAGAKIGDVVGPTSATDGHLAVFDTTTGKLLKDGGAVPAGGGSGDVVGLQSQLDSVRPFPAPVVTATYAVPLTIEHTGATEVSAALRTFIDSVPNGSIISFPVGATYKLHGSLFIQDRNNLIFDGNGATLQVDATAAGTSAYTAPFFIGDTPAHPNTDIVIHDFILIGNSPTPGIYDENSEAQSNIHSSGATRLEIYNITGSAAHADLVYIEHGQDIWVHDCHEISAGRMGFTAISGSDMLVENNVFDDSGYYVFDIEPNAISDACSRIIIRNNVIGTWGTVGESGGGGFLGIEGGLKGAAIDEITVDGNLVTGGSLLMFCDNGGTAGTRMTRITFTNNKGTVAAGPVFRFAHVDGLTVAGNVQPLSSGDLMSIADCTVVLLSGINPEVQALVDSKQALIDAKLTFAPVNLIVNGDFETDVLGWALNTDGAISRETVSPLVGTGSLKWVQGTISTGIYAWSTGTFIVGHRYYFAAKAKSTATAGKKMFLGINDVVGAKVDCSVSPQIISIIFTATGTAQYGGPSLDGSAVAGDYFLIDSVVCYDLDVATTATAAELNALDGITATTAELNYTDGVTSAIQTQLAAKAPLAPAGAAYTPATGAQTVALNVTAGNMHVVAGHASGTAITFTITGATNNQPFVVSILQGAVVSTIAAWFATVRWCGGAAPTLTATANKRDTFGFIRTGANTYDGFVIGQNA